MTGTECRKEPQFAGWPGTEDGQAMAEFAIAFPLQLLIIFAIMQLAMVYVAKQVVSYASYQAARSAVVADDLNDAYVRASRASALICSPITGPTVAGSNFSVGELYSGDNMIEVPGWGLLPKSGISQRLKTHVSRLESYPDRGEVEVTVTHYYELTLPLVNHVFSWLVGGEAAGDADEVTGPTGTTPYGGEREFEEAVGIWNVEAPHMRLRETTRLVIPGS